MDELVFDAWTPISFKRAMQARSASSAGTGWQAPSWVGDHARRLMAYTVLRAYQDNAAREFMVAKDRDSIDERREYGDASLIVQQTVAALLGESQAVVVEGAEDWDPDAADGDDGDGDGEADNAEARRAFELQEWLRDWAADERLGMKMLEAERRAVGLGDAVYSLGWSNEKGRPRLRVWDPGFYFPVLDDGNEDDFPRKVHIAWELESDDGKRRVRRITWELVDAAGAVDEDGRPARPYAHPWNDGPTTVTCLLSDGTWTLDKGASKVAELTEADAEWETDEDGEVRNRDLGIDFLPVVHVPNTVSLIEHYGRSTLSAVLQVLDDLASADTDLSKASATTGSPVIALSKATLGAEPPTYRPGQVFEVGEGRMDVLDTSRALDALIKYIEFLLKRLSTNSRIPEAVLGRVAPSEVPSGIALALSFGPMEQMVKEMRLVRDEKYPLLLKFAHRMAVAGQMEGAPTDFDLKPRVEMGSFLPQDQAEAVGLVTQLLAAKPRPAISLETAVGMLVEAGLPIRDAVLEVQRIQERDFEGASLLLDALGEDELVWEYLGKKKPATTQREEERETEAEQARLVPPTPPGTELGPDGQPVRATPPQQ